MSDTGDNRTGPAAGDKAVLDVGAMDARLRDDWIARRAYALYESREREPGHANEDWFRAEAEFMTRRGNRQANRSFPGNCASLFHQDRYGRV